jgi:hypothetical protein
MTKPLRPLIRRIRKVTYRDCRGRGSSLVTVSISDTILVPSPQGKPPLKDGEGNKWIIKGY